MVWLRSSGAFGLAVKVFFIAKVKDLNSEYKDMSKRIRELGTNHPGLALINAGFEANGFNR